MTEISTRVKTPAATLSYPWLAKAQPVSDEDAAKGAKPKFSAVLVFKPGTDLRELQQAALAAAEAKWPGKVQEMIAKSKASIQAGGPITFRVPFRNDVDGKYEEGSTFINCRADTAPGLVYAHAEPGSNKAARVASEDIEKVFYPGAQVRASITAFAYDKKGNRGVGFALNNMQKIAEGERLDNRVAAEDEFEADLSQPPAELDGLMG